MLDQVTRMLPVDQARDALLPPVRLLREAAVVVARTARHWEIVLAGEDPADRARWRVLSDALMGGHGTTTVAGVHQQEGSWGRMTGEVSGSGDLTPPSSGDLAVDGWAELPYAEAQARTSGLDEESLQILLAYERTHGHRPLFEQLLEHRLTEASRASV